MIVWALGNDILQPLWYFSSSRAERNRISRYSKFLFQQFCALSNKGIFVFSLYSILCLPMQSQYLHIILPKYTHHSIECVVCVYIFCRKLHKFSPKNPAQQCNGNFIRFSRLKGLLYLAILKLNKVDDRKETLWILVLWNCP